MADEDLLIKLPEPPQKPLPGARTANWLSVAAIIISVLAASFAGLQWWEERHLRFLTQAPLLEITSAEFVGPSTLFLTLHNIGHSSALGLKIKNEAYIGWLGILRANFSKVFGRAQSGYMKSIPVGQDAQIGTYMPEE